MIGIISMVSIGFSYRGGDGTTGSSLLPPAVNTKTIITITARNAAIPPNIHNLFYFFSIFSSWIGFYGTGSTSAFCNQAY